jgi:hypothetical protein
MGNDLIQFRDVIWGGRVSRAKINADPLSLNQGGSGQIRTTPRENCQVAPRDLRMRRVKVGLLGIHTNMPATVPPEIDKAALVGAPTPSGLSAEEKNAYERLAFFYTRDLAYAQEMGTRPQTLYGSRTRLSASPLGYSTTTYAVTS